MVEYRVPQRQIRHYSESSIRFLLLLKVGECNVVQTVCNHSCVIIWRTCCKLETISSVESSSSKTKQNIDFHSAVTSAVTGNTYLCIFSSHVHRLYSCIVLYPRILDKHNYCGQKVKKHFQNIIHYSTSTAVIPCRWPSASVTWQSQV